MRIVTIHDELSAVLSYCAWLSVFPYFYSVLSTFQMNS